MVASSSGTRPTTQVCVTLCVSMDGLHRQERIGGEQTHLVIEMPNPVDPPERLNLETFQAS